MTATDLPQLERMGLSPLQARTYTAVAERNQERTSMYDQRLITIFPDLTDFSDPVIVGSFAYTCQKQKTKWYQRHHARNFGGGWTTPGDLARDYLALKFPKRKPHCTSRQWRECVEHPSDPPLYCAPQRLTEALYVDLSAAYWQITRAVGWDVDYCPNAWLGQGEEMIDWPWPGEKMARNCLVSVGQGSGALSIWTGKEMIYQKKPNRFINLVLWRLVCDILNGIALDMIERAGAVYAYVDGYIIPQDKLEIAEEISRSWGVDFRIKRSGSADIKAAASYAFSSKTEGYYATEPYKLMPEHSYGIDKAYDPNRTFLRERFRRFAEQAKQDWMFAEKGGIQ